MKVKLNGVLKSDEIVGNVPQSKDLPLRKSIKICENGDRLQPVMTDPSERKKSHAEVSPAQMFQQVLRRIASTLRIGGQFRAVAGNICGVSMMECSPELRQTDLLPYLVMPVIGAVCQCPFQAEGLSQQPFVGQIKPISVATEEELAEIQRFGASQNHSQ